MHQTKPAKVKLPEESTEKDRRLCPHCHRLGISIIEQLFFTGRTAFTVRCKYCKKRVAVDRSRKFFAVSLTLVLSVVFICKVLKLPTEIPIGILIILGIVLMPFGLRHSRVVKLDC